MTILRAFIGAALAIAAFVVPCGLGRWWFRKNCGATSGDPRDSLYASAFEAWMAGTFFVIAPWVLGAGMFAAIVTLVCRL